MVAAGMLLLATWWTGPIPAVLSGWEPLRRVDGMVAERFRRFNRHVA